LIADLFVFELFVLRSGTVIHDQFSCEEEGPIAVFSTGGLVFQCAHTSGQSPFFGYDCGRSAVSAFLLVVVRCANSLTVPNSSRYKLMFTHPAWPAGRQW